MNNFVEAFKNQISTFGISTNFLNSFASLLFRKILFKVLPDSMKILTNSGDFTGSLIRIPPPPPPPPPPNKNGGNSQGIVNLNSSFEKANSPIISLVF
jgi:hypothetical protein